jgi:outer membrane protein assembly factor BamE (lipoprotein component of BamABCDE complex)
MRFAAAILIFVCLAACSVMSAPQDDGFATQGNQVRQQQAAQDADVILQGMAQARQHAQELARSAR